MLRSNQRNLGNVRQRIRQRGSVRHARPVNPDAFNDVHDELARDYRLNRIVSLRNTRASAVDQRTRIPFTTESASRVRLRGYADIYIHQNNRFIYSDIAVYLHAMQPVMRAEVLAAWRTWRGLGMKLGVGIIYSGVHGADDTFEERMWSKPFYIFNHAHLDARIADMLADIETRSLLFYEQGSDKIIVEINRRSELKLWIQDRAPGIIGSGDLSVFDGGKFVKLPGWIQSKRACINIQNKDELCFKYCMELAIRRRNLDVSVERDPQRLTKWYFEDIFDYTGVDFPSQFEDIDTFEANNAQHQVCVRVFVPREDVNRSLSLVRDCEELIHKYNQPFIVMLLLVPDETNTNYHYVFIKEDGLWLLTRTHLADTGHRRFGCRRCLRDFNNDSALTHHITYQCEDNHYRQPDLPWPHEAQKYFSRMDQFNEKPFVIIYDFEALNEKVEHPFPEEESKTQASKRTVQVPVSLGIYAVCPQIPELSLPPYIYTVTTPTRRKHDLAVNRTTVMFQFHEWLFANVKYFEECIKAYFSFPFSGAESMTDEQKQHFKDTDTCCICNLHIYNGTMPHWAWHVPDDFDCQGSKFHTVYYMAKMFDTTEDMYPRCEALRRRILSHNRAVDYAHWPDLEEQNYRGPAHWICARSIGKYGPIPCIAHNATRYDNHMVIQGFKPMRFRTDNRIRNSKIFNCISAESDRFKTFTLNSTYQFLDSIAYLGASLDKLVENTLKDSAEHKAGRVASDQFPFAVAALSKYVMDEFGGNSPSLIRMLLKKGEYPYEWLDCPTKLLTTEPPPWEAFRSSLRLATTQTDQDIRDKTYPAFLNVWDLLADLKGEHYSLTMLEYHNLYLFRDLVLLADVVINYRKQCVADSGLEVLGNPTVPGYTEAHLLLYNTLKQPSPRTDPFYIHLFHKGQEDMYTMFEEGIRGGLSIAPGRYARANNRYLPDYDPTQPDSFIMYFDMTNLYGSAMCMWLPYDDFVWLEAEEEGLELLDHWLEVGRDCKDDSEVGFTYEVDGFFPEEYHNYLQDLPPLPHKQAVNSVMVSQYYKDTMAYYGLKHDNKTPKLLASLLPRKNYIVDYRVLRQAEDLGFEITKVHRVCQYTQKPWTKDYVQYNTLSRKFATTQQAQDYFKLKINAGYGKMIQNTRKHKKVEMRMTDQKLTSSQQERGEVQPINSEFSLITMEEPKVRLNSPVYAGFVILELSKYQMYDFYYHKLRQHFQKRVRLLFMDTDSLCVHISSSDVMLEMNMAGMLKHFDMNDWPKDTSYHGENYHDPTNKKVPGTMKDEMAGSRDYIREVVALKSKMYSLDLGDNKQKATAKGVPEDVKRKILQHEQYKDCLLQAGEYERTTLPKVTTHTMRSEVNTITVRSQTKVTLNPCDPKYYMVDPYTTLPYGHYKTIEPLQVTNPLDTSE